MTRSVERPVGLADSEEAAVPSKFESTSNEGLDLLELRDPSGLAF